MQTRLGCRAHADCRTRCSVPAVILRRRGSGALRDAPISGVNAVGDFLPGVCPEPLRCGSRMTPTARLLQGVHRALSVRVLVALVRYCLPVCDRDRQPLLPNVLRVLSGDFRPDCTVF